MLTERDKLIYREMFGDEGVYQEILSWDVNTPLTLYKTKEYKKYNGHYLKVIFDKVKVEVTGSSSYNYKRFNFKGKEGVLYSGEFDLSNEPKSFNIGKLGIEHLKEFIDYYTYDIVVNYIQEGLEDLEDGYRDKLYNNLLNVTRFMTKELEGGEGFEYFKEDTYLTGDRFLMRAVQDNVDEYFLETGRQGDLYSNKWYRELQDRVMATIRNKNERKYNRTRPRFTSLWDD